MDMYGLSGQDCFRIDDLLDFSNEDQLFSSTTTDSDHHQHHLPSSENTSSAGSHPPATNPSYHFTDDLCVPSDDVAELEWLSNFVDDSFTDFPENSLTGTVNFRSDASIHGRSRSKRTKAPSNNSSWASTPESDTQTVGKLNTNIDSTKKRENYSPSSSENSEAVARRCTHCASEKTPQWRSGPLGPKTLCNACGVRYKSGRLVPEYRPAASPTFILTQHSNSHRKVMELRRQKEQQPQQEHQLYGHHHRHNFEVC